MSQITDEFSAGQAAKIAGVAYRTLDHWARTGIIEPSLAAAQGTGSERKYSFEDLVALRVARELRVAGVSLQSLRTITQRLRLEKNIRNPLSGDRFVVVGSDVVIVQSCREVVSALRKPGQQLFAFMIDLRRTVMEVEQQVKAFRAA